MVKPLNSCELDQCPLLRISIVEIPTALAFELDADFVDYPLKVFASTLNNFKTVIIHLNIVDVETALCGLTKIKRSCHLLLCHSFVFSKSKSSKRAIFIGFVDLPFLLVFVLLRSHLLSLHPR